MPSAPDAGEKIREKLAAGTLPHDAGGTTFAGYGTGRLCDGCVECSIGTKHYPGSQVMLRIDNEPPLSAKEPGFTGGQASDILERFATNAQRIRTRYREFPGKFVDGELSTKGFAEALGYVRSASGIEAPSPKAPQ